MARFELRSHYTGWLNLVWVVVGVALARLLPHPPNFTPLVATAIFSGAMLGASSPLRALVVPLAALLVSDLALGFHPYVLFTYGATAAIVFFVGFRYLSVRKTPAGWGHVGAAGLISSLLFFVISNFGVWVMDGGVTYPLNSGGLALCYAAAIPFFWTALAGDLLFTLAIFGTYALLISRSLALPMSNGRAPV